jgi:hypothetical protein
MANPMGVLPAAAPMIPPAAAPTPAPPPTRFPVSEHPLMTRPRLTIRINAINNFFMVYSFPKQLNILD